MKQKIKALRADQADLFKKARAKADEITDTTPQARALEISAEFDRMMAEYDARQVRIDQMEKMVDVERDLNRPDPRRPVETGEARGVDDGGFAQRTEDRDFALAPEQRMTTWATARNAAEFDGLTLGRYLRSMVTGASNDLERRALAGGTDSAGGYTTPDILSAEMIDLLRANSVLSAAGARTIPLASDRNSIAAVASDPVPAWRLENAAVAESDPTFRSVALVPRALAVMTKVPVELLQDSLNIEQALPNILAAALGAELDRVGLLGTGVAPQPLGINNTPGIGSTAFGASLTNYGPLITARTGLLTANSDLSAYIMHPRDEGKLAGMLDSTGQPLSPPAKIANVRMLTTTVIPTNLGAGTNESIIFAGRWQDMLIGIRSDIRIEIIKEAFMGNLQYAFVAWLRADIAVRQPASFHKVTGVRP